MVHRATLIGLSVLLSVGCHSSTTPAPDTGEYSPKTAETAFYLPGMNKRLKIL